MLDTPAFRAVRALPGCVGLSVWRMRDGVPSTVLALDAADDDLDQYADPDAAVLDAVQFVHTGPGTEAADVYATVDAPTPQDLHERWAVFAAASGTRGVRGAVAVPFGTRQRRLLGVVVLYLTRPTLVDLSLVRLAETVGLVTLLQEGTFAPRSQRARVASGRDAELLEAARLGLAGLLLERAEGLVTGSGRARLRDAAARAGVAPVALADAITDVLDHQQG